MPKFANAIFLLNLALLCGCGGSSGASGAGGPAYKTATATVNSVPIVIDAGPAQVYAVNAPYTSVTLCAPGSATQCQTIDHILVDTGSSGFRVLAAALGGDLTPRQLTASVDAAGNPIVECTQFADGYSWGPVKLADLKIGTELASSTPIQVIGDPDFPSAQIPQACSNMPDGEEDTVDDFGANGVLGIGNFVQDCGSYCAQEPHQDGSAYNACDPQMFTCNPAEVPLSQQVSNPVAFFATDNNGVVIQLPTVNASGAVSTRGNLLFGIGTQSDNALGSAKVLALDPGRGTFQTEYAGIQLGSSFIDSGSNGYFFPSTSIPVCVDQDVFYCPGSTLALSAVLQGENGVLANVAFSVGNADALLNADTADPDLAGPAGDSEVDSFDWGLPFFFGRNVYVSLEGTTIGGVTGPAVAF